MNSNALALKSMEKLLLAQGFLYCQVSGQKITSPDDLTIVNLNLGTGRILTLPVHKAHTKQLLQTELTTFFQGLPSLDGSEAEDDGLN